MVGLAGEGQNFDGNGMYVRFQPGGGDQTVSHGQGAVGGTSDAALRQRDRPSRSARARAFPGKRPPYKPDVPCYTNRLPDLNGAATGPPDGASRRRAPRPRGRQLGGGPGPRGTERTR